MGDTTSAYINAGAQVAGAAINSIATTADSHKAYTYQHKLMDRAYRRNLEMWNTANAYNAPSAQMQRLVEAGLNPNLVYGHGSVENTADTPPQMQAQGLRPYVQQDFGIGDAVDAFFRTRQAEAAIKNMEEQNSNLRTQNSFIAAQAAKTLVETGLLEDDKKVRSELNNYALQSAQMGLRKIESEIELNQQHVTESQSRITNLGSQTFLNYAKAKNLAALNTKIAAEVALLSVKKDRESLGLRFDQETYNHNFEALELSLDRASVEIANLKKSGKLTDEKVREIGNKIAVEWSKFGVTSAAAVSKEVNRWLYFWRLGSD